MRKFSLGTFLVVTIAAVFSVCCSCDSSIPLNPESDGTSRYVYLGTSEETVDSKVYTVKSYADVNVDEPYFYTYYKYYYMDGNLRRVYTFYHDSLVFLDVMYSDFMEHFCTEGCSYKIREYREDGSVFSIFSYTTKGSGINIFDEEGMICQTKSFDKEGVCIAEAEFYSNGNTKRSTGYLSDGVTKKGVQEYYENGNRKETWSYSEVGNLLSHGQYWENGNIKEGWEFYENGQLKVHGRIYENGSNQEVFNYAEDGKLISHAVYYNNGKVKAGTQKSVRYGREIFNYTDSYESGVARLSYTTVDEVLESFSLAYESGCYRFYYSSQAQKLYEYDDLVCTYGNDSLHSKNTISMIEQEAFDWIEEHKL